MLLKNIFQRELNGKENILSFLNCKSALRRFQVYESQLENLLMKGHVIFGFLKNNTLLLSYKILEDQIGMQISLCIYLWYFYPNFSIGKILKKQIFANEKFSIEKFKALQWPDNDSKIVILCIGKSFFLNCDNNSLAYLAILTIPNYLTIYQNDIDTIYIETKYEIPETYKCDKLVTLLSNESLYIVTNYSIIVLSFVTNELSNPNKYNKDIFFNKTTISLYDLKLRNFYEDRNADDLRYLSNFEEKDNFFLINDKNFVDFLEDYKLESNYYFKLSKNILDKNILRYLELEKFQDHCLNLIDENLTYDSVQNNFSSISEQYFLLNTDQQTISDLEKYNENILPIDVFFKVQKLISKNSMNSNNEKAILKMKQSHLDLDTLISTLINNYKLIPKYEYTQKSINVCSISQIILFEVQLFYDLLTIKKSKAECVFRECFLYISWDYATGEAKILNILEPFCDHHGFSFESLFKSIPSYMFRTEYEPLILQDNASNRSVNKIVDNENVFSIHMDDVSNESSCDLSFERDHSFFNDTFNNSNIDNFSDSNSDNSI